MAKHPVPKQRSTHQRSSRRYGTFLSKTLKRLSNVARTIACPKCQQPRLPHTACPTCGEYRGHTIIDFGKKEAKVKQVKA